MQSSSYYQPVSHFKEQSSPYRNHFMNSESEKKRDLSYQRPRLSDNLTQLKYEEIRKKYGSKQKNIGDVYQSTALKDISLRHSNYNSIAGNKSLSRYEHSIEKKYESKTNSGCPTQSPQPFTQFRRESFTTSSFLKEDSKELILNGTFKPTDFENRYRNTSDGPATPSAYPSLAYRPRNTRLDTSTISKSIQNYNPESSGKQRQRQRVGSIDKINMKIYQILNCLSENTDKRESMKCDLLKSNNESKIQKQNKIESIPKQTSKDNQLYVPNEIYRIQTESSVQKMPISAYRHELTCLTSNSIGNTANRVSRRIQIPSLDRTRRHSMLTSSFHDPSKLKTSSAHNQQSRRSSSILKDRDIDEEIRRIQQRIKNTEEKKKKLNISCQQWKQKQTENQSSIPKRVLTHSKGIEKSSALLERKHRLYNNSVFKITENQAQEKKQSSAKISEQAQQKEQGELQEQVIPVNVNNVNLPVIKQTSSQQNSSSRTTPSNNRIGLRNLVVNNIKASILYNQEPPLPSSTRSETKRLIEVLKDQVSYDQCLRNAKVLLSSHQQPNKNQIINEILLKNGINLTQQQFKKQIQTTLEEHNPFFSVKQSTQPIEQLVSKYVDSYRHWNDKVKGKFSEEVFKKEGFSEEKIDLQKKGILSLEDLVRFLNIETGNFYRNRDVILLFRRITNNGNIQFGQLIEVLCTK